MSDYTQGVCHDGAAILKDGMPLTIEEILEVLRERDQLDELLKAAGIDAQEIKAENQQLRNKRDELNRAVGEEIDERDRMEGWADGLAKLTGVEIGEHSSANCPWLNAVQAAAEFEHSRDRRDARMKAEALEELISRPGMQHFTAFRAASDAAAEYRKQAEVET